MSTLAPCSADSSAVVAAATGGSDSIRKGGGSNGADKLCVLSEPTTYKTGKLCCQPCNCQAKTDDSSSGLRDTPTDTVPSTVTLFGGQGG